MKTREVTRRDVRDAALVGQIVAPDLLGAPDLHGWDLPLEGDLGMIELLKSAERGLGGDGRG